MDEAFLEAWVNREHRVCGRKLHAFCLSDMLALEAIGSPMCVMWGHAHQPIKRADVALAALICSVPHDRWMQCFQRRYRLAAYRMRTSWRWTLYETKRFEAYVLDHLSAPEVWTESGEGGTLNAPWLLAKAVFLLHNTSLTREEVWTRPIGEILWYAAALAEQMGGANILSEEERRIADDIERDRKEAEK